MKLNCSPLRTRIPRRLLLGAAFAVAIPLTATTILYEGFDLPPGELDFNAGATSFGFSDAAIGGETWNAFDDSAFEEYHGVSDGGLEYNDLPVIGNAFEFRDEEVQANNYVYRKLPKFYTYYSSGQLWFSALFEAKIDGDASNGGFIQLCLADFPAKNDIYMGIANSRDYSRWSAGGERLKVDNVNGEKWGFSSVPVIDGVPVFLVMHIDFDAKEAYFWANPPVDAEDPGEPDVTFGLWTDLFVDRIMLWGLNAGASQEGDGADYTGSRIDEIRLGDTYASVAADADLTDPGGGEVDTTPPVITGPSGTAGDTTGTVSIEETTVRVHTFTADEDVTWSVTGGADADLFSVGIGTGGLSLKTFADFENPTDANTDNVYEVEVTATDTAGNTAMQSLAVTILDVENEPWAEHWTASPEGWVSTDANGGSFMGWINVKNDPWLFSYSLNKYLYINTENITETGTWFYLPISGALPSGEGDWLGYTATADGWISTNANGVSFVDWLNVTNAPWVFSLSFNHYIYLPDTIVSDSGTWVYTPIVLPVIEEGTAE
jgi:hypothetical protein